MNKNSKKKNNFFHKETFLLYKLFQLKKQNSFDAKMPFNV